MDRLDCVSTPVRALHAHHSSTHALKVHFQSRPLLQEVSSPLLLSGFPSLHSYLTTMPKENNNNTKVKSTLPTFIDDRSWIARQERLFARSCAKSWRKWRPRQRHRSRPRPTTIWRIFPPRPSPPHHSPPLLILFRFSTPGGFRMSTASMSVSYWRRLLLPCLSLQATS